MFLFTLAVYWSSFPIASHGRIKFAEAQATGSERCRKSNKTQGETSMPCHGPSSSRPDRFYATLILKSDLHSITILFPLTFSHMQFYCFMLHFHVSLVKRDGMRPAEKVQVRGGKWIVLAQQTLFRCVFLIKTGKCTFPPGN